MGSRTNAPAVLILPVPKQPLDRAIKGLLGQGSLRGSRGWLGQKGDP